MTDLYQLTMAYGYWKNNRHDWQACFELSFRKNPFGGGYAVSCGLATLIDFIENWHCSDDDADYLRSLKTPNGEVLFEDAFVDYLQSIELKVDIDAIPEGRLVFGGEPIVRVRGPILQCQLLETALINIVNFQTLIATKASRVTYAAAGGPILEFGLRRAQGFDGGLSASRAAYIGGCSATSNVLAGKLFDIPVRGTHAHSWVMAYESEQEAFDALADAMPDNIILLVDTYDSHRGVQKAIETAKKLAARGKKLIGIRLDSGDLTQLSIDARKLLDDAGFPEVLIYASNDLDEYIIENMRQQGCRIDAWGVGTKLVTATEQPSLGAVYKLTAVKKNMSDAWRPCLKLSEQLIKISDPGVHQIRRFYNHHMMMGDMIYDVESLPEKTWTMVHPHDMTKRSVFKQNMTFEDLLVPIFKGGALIYTQPNISGIKALLASEFAKLPAAMKRFLNPHIYPVGLELGLFQEKASMILAARQGDL
jgi:nicotinate phosphoribosyltransferase